MNLPLLLKLLLWPFSLLYGAAAWLRSWLYQRGWLKQKRLNAKVISVGNLTVGGTGKTPMVIWLAQRFVAQGKRVAILSRGYRGHANTSDEVALMRKRLGDRVLFGVGKDRYAEGVRLSSESVDIFILDDGFQHLSLARDIDIVMVDASRALRTEWLIPAGRLREPRSALHRADLVIFTRTELAKLTVSAIQKFPQFAIYPSTTSLLGFRKLSLVPESNILTQTLSGPLFAFCGIGNPEAFWQDLHKWGLNIVGTKTFRDHHRYSLQDLKDLESAAKSKKAVALVTTEKDMQNIGSDVIGKLTVYIAVTEISLPDESQFMRDLNQQLTQSHGAAA